MRLGEVEPLAVGQRARHPGRGAPAAKARGHRPQHRHHLLRDPVAAHQLGGEGVLALGVLAEVGEARCGDPDRRNLGPRVRADDLDQAEVVDVLVGEDDQLEVGDRVAVLAELGLQLVESLAGVGTGVDQGQRLVLDQVAVDPADRERGRDAQAMDPGVPGSLERLLGAHSRINPRTSSRLLSMCSRESSDSRLSRSSGSVFDGRTLKCQSG